MPRYQPSRSPTTTRTEESWTGAQIEADPATVIRYLAPGLDACLADLKARAEGQACHG